MGNVPFLLKIMAMNEPFKEADHLNLITVKQFGLELSFFK